MPYNKSKSCLLRNIITEKGRIIKGIIVILIHSFIINFKKPKVLENFKILNYFQSFTIFLTSFRSYNKYVAFLCNTYALDCTIMQKSQIKYVNIALQFE